MEKKVWFYHILCDRVINDNVINKLLQHNPWCIYKNINQKYENIPNSDYYILIFEKNYKFHWLYKVLQFIIFLNISF